MRLSKLRSWKLLATGCLILCGHTLEAQTLESSIAPSAVKELLLLSPPTLDDQQPETPSGADALTSTDDSRGASRDELPQKTDTAMPEIQVRGSAAESRFSMDDVSHAIEGMLSKKKITGALVGTTISAALSAHPVGAFLGGLVGAMVGKESKYKPQASPASSLAQQDLFATLNDMNLTTLPEASEDTQRPVDSLASKTTQVTNTLSANNPSDHCYRQVNSTQTRDRSLLQSCFYYMY